MIPDDSVPIRDPLFVRAVAFREGGHCVAWATLDICFVSRGLRERVLRDLAGRGVALDSVVLSATHTHTAPTGIHFNGVEHMPEDYERFLEEEVILAITEAVRTLRPAEISYGRTCVDLSVNRRQIGRIAEVNDLRANTGLVDSEVRIAEIRILEDDHIGILFNYAAHPLTMSREPVAISADYPGRAIRRLRRNGFAHAQFIQGCAGNVNVKIHGHEAEAEAVGGILAEAVMAAANSAIPSKSSRVRSVSRTVHLPLTGIPELETARRTLAEVSATKSRDARTEGMREWAESVVHLLERGDVRPYLEVLVQALRVGDAVFVALPGEEFVETGLEIKRRAGLEDLFVAGYANCGEIGYVATEEAWKEGGYEVEEAPFWFGPFPLSPRCARIIVESALAAIAAVRD